MPEPGGNGVVKAGDAKGDSIRCGELTPPQGHLKFSELSWGLPGLVVNVGGRAGRGVNTSARSVKLAVELVLGVLAGDRVVGDKIGRSEVVGDDDGET